MSDNVENLTLTGTTAISGTGNASDNIITGNSGANILTGEDGNDTLIGGAGNDTLIGGLGDDYYVFGSGDTVIEDFDAGIDTIEYNNNSNINQAGYYNIENLILTGTSNIYGIGNALDNIIIGNTGNNTLTGNDGNDVLDGGIGNDTLLGGSGNDSLIGSDGNDSLDGGIGIDSMAGGAGNDVYIVDDAGDVVNENADEGTDIINSSVTYTLSDNVENLTLTGTSDINGIGNALDNTITGNTGANILDGGIGNDILNGGAGADTLIGGLGDDAYYVDNVGDTITEYSGEGTDIINSSVTYTLSDNVENLTLTCQAPILWSKFKVSKLEFLIITAGAGGW